MDRILCAKQWYTTKHLSLSQCTLYVTPKIVRTLDLQNFFCLMRVDCFRQFVEPYLGNETLHETNYHDQHSWL